MQHLLMILKIFCVHRLVDLGGPAARPRTERLEVLPNLGRQRGVQRPELGLGRSIEVQALERAILGHVRLAVIDPENGKQPMSNTDDTVWITFNGEIYNYVELRDELKAKGYHYHYVFTAGAGHNDGKVVKATLPDALAWLWRGYPIK